MNTVEYDTSGFCSWRRHMAGESLDLDVINSLENRDYVEDEPKGVLKTMSDVAELHAYFRT